MTRVQELLEVLRTVPPDSFVVVPAFDHSYRHICRAELIPASIGEGTCTRPRSFLETGGEETPDQIVQIFCIQ